LFPAEIATRFRDVDARVLANDAVIRHEVTLTLPGATRPTTSIVQKFALHDADGRIYGLCGISTDITDRKEAEAEKLGIERKLLAAQKLESLGVLAGGIAHDFNNILTSVLANASLARHDATTGKPVDRSLVQIENAARRAADLCQQMLAYAGKGKIVTDRIDLSELVRGTTALLEVTLKQNVRLELRLGTGLPPVLADPTQLRQIVMNLVINAGDAITGPEGVITVTTFTREVDASLLHGALGSPDLLPGTYAGLEVRDNGCGMPPETIARIFEPFFTTKFSGRGLGLSAVLGIVQSHRGALFVESTPGQGSTFRLLLPATKGPAVSSASPFPAAPIRSILRGTALVVDDEEAVRSVAATVLELHGARVLVAPSGEEALNLVAIHQADISVVLLDMTMPGIGGEETLRRMRLSHARQPVILMSGYGENETMQRCADLGVVSFMQKPFEIDTLLTTVKAFLS
jgi:signal transduction histidine kinase/CheY-like chemotaxis protein